MRLKHICPCPILLGCHNLRVQSFIIALGPGKVGTHPAKPLTLHDVTKPRNRTSRTQCFDIEVRTLLFFGEAFLA